VARLCNGLRTGCPFLCLAFCKSGSQRTVEIPRIPWWGAKARSSGPLPPHIESRARYRQTLEVFKRSQVISYRISKLHLNYLKTDEGRGMGGRKESGERLRVRRLILAVTRSQNEILLPNRSPSPTSDMDAG